MYRCFGSCCLLVTCIQATVSSGVPWPMPNNGDKERSALVSVFIANVAPYRDPVIFFLKLAISTSCSNFACSDSLTYDKIRIKWPIIRSF